MTLQLPAILHLAIHQSRKVVLSMVAAVSRTSQATINRTMWKGVYSCRALQPARRGPKGPFISGPCSYGHVHDITKISIREIRFHGQWCYHEMQRSCGCLPHQLLMYPSIRQERNTDDDSSTGLLFTGTLDCSMIVPGSADWSNTIRSGSTTSRRFEA